MVKLGGQGAHKAVRAEMMKVLSDAAVSPNELPKWISNLFGTKEDVLEYVDHHRKQGSWATEKELYIAAKRSDFNVMCIIIFNYFSDIRRRLSK